MRFLDIQGRYLREHKRVLLADADGIAVSPVPEYIKLLTSYIFEVNLKYFYASYDCDNDYLFAPEIMQIKTEMLSKKQMRLQRVNYGDNNFFSRKLICSLFPKKRYVVLIERRKFYI